MFNFSERTIGEKIVMIGGGVLVVGNTVVNIINSVKVRNVKKRLENVGNNTSDNNQPQDNQQPQNNDNQTQQ